jgi:Uma2 family endonuclease
MEYGGAPVHPLSFDDVLAMDAAGVLPEGRRFELEDGVLVDVTPTGAPHDHAVGWLNMHFAGARSGWHVWIQSTLRIAGGYLSPDLLLIEPLPRTEHPWTARLAIEVAVTSHARDRHKIGLYARALVHEYWIVDLVAGEVIVHRGCRDGGYADVQRHGPGDTVAAPEGIPPVPVTDLLG